MSNPQDNTLDDIMLKPAHWKYDDYQKAKVAIQAYISKHYLSKEEVKEVIGEDEPHTPVVDGVSSARNKLRKTQRLSLKEKLCR